MPSRPGGGRKRGKNARDWDERSEAELEARIGRAIAQALPFLAADEIRHQLRFTIKLGHRAIEVEGNAQKAGGVCDILILSNGRPLAIMELKRPGKVLTDDDRTQGLSYARLIEPWAPLVVVTNGTETQLFETYSGAAWDPKNPSEEALAELMSASNRLAEEDLRNAVGTLLGPGRDVWMALVREISQRTIRELTGAWSAPLRPFPDGLIFPRKATQMLVERLHGGARAVILAGGPLSGKSNVLRELTSKANDDDYAVLLLDGGSAGHGILQTIANALTQNFGWSISKDDVRSWLSRLSSSPSEPALVIAVDGADTMSMRAELDELASAEFGPNLRLIVTVDESDIETLTKSISGRQATRFGNLAGEPVNVATLDDAEFDSMAVVLYEHRIGFMNGAQRASEYRIPWLVRSIVADAISDAQHSNEELMAYLPSLVGRMLLAHVRKRFADNVLLVGRYTTLAQAVIADLESPGMSKAFAITSVHALVCTFDTARACLGEADLEHLFEQGYLKHRLLGGERMVVPQVPELLSATVSTVLARRLIESVHGDAEGETKRLVRVCARIPAGDVIGAEAIVEAAKSLGGLPYEVISTLRDSPPKEEPLKPGTRFVLSISGTELNAKVSNEGDFSITSSDGRTHPFTVNGNEITTMSGMTSWLILSYVLGMRLDIVREEEGEEIVGGVHPELLLQVGTCPFALRNPASTPFENVRLHDVPGGSIVCHKEGIIEPITLSLMQVILRDKQCGQFLVEEAVRRNNAPLLSRLHIALSRLSELREQDGAAWAKDVLETQVWPALQAEGLWH